MIITKNISQWQQALRFAVQLVSSKRRFWKLLHKKHVKFDRENVPIANK